MVKRLIRWIGFAQRQHIRHLEADVAFWKAQYIHERSRAEAAIDHWRVLLATQHRAPSPVMPLTPTPGTELEQAEKRALDELIHNADYQSVGLTPEGLHG